MLTISQLAAYAGVTVRAVRHYHRIGLLPEPQRNHSGYRSYDAQAVVRLIRIRALAKAGVPLARVQELLDATPEGFARGIEEIDGQLRREIRRLQDARTQIKRLAAGEHLALPPSVVGYLERLRSLGIAERYIAMERDAWIMLAARMPGAIDDTIASKHQELDDPDMLRLYHLFSEALDWSADDPRVVEIADILERLMERSLQAGEPGGSDLDTLDDSFVELLDTTMAQTSELAQRLLTILAERGWKGWTRVERTGTLRAAGEPAQ